MLIVNCWSELKFLKKSCLSMLKAEINDARSTKKSETENVDRLSMKVLVIEVSEKKLEWKKLRRLRSIVKNSDRNRISREAEGFDGVELELKNRNLKLTKLFLYEAIVESKRSMTCLSLTDEICHSSEYDDRRIDADLIFLWIDLAAADRSLLTIISWIDSLIEMRKSILWEFSTCR